MQVVLFYFRLGRPALGVPETFHEVSPPLDRCAVYSCGEYGGQMPLDPEILSLVAASQRGEAVPAITVLAGGMLMIGRPAPALALADALREAKEAELTADLIPAGGWKGLTKVNKDEARRQAERLAEESVASLRLAPDSEVESLTLVNVSVIPSQGDGLLLPALRVPWTAIDAWWMGKGRVIKAQPSLFFGVSLPI